MNIDIPAVGAFLDSEQRCSFTVWAPLKKRVEVLLWETNTRYPMKKNELGYWSAFAENISAKTKYRFILDGDKDLPDPASRSQPDGVHGPSAVVDRSFRWNDESWKGLQLGDMVIYEMHVGTFTRSGDFEGVISKLPYLKTLGINAIELMPLSQFPGDRNWGYDGVFPFCVQGSYGGDAALKKLVDLAHQHGIAVILDVVYNHQGPEGNYFAEYGPYFTEKYKTGWGQAINFDDAWCDGVRNYYWQNALMWLDEFRIDGLRMDAVHAIWDFSANHFIEVLNKKVRELERKTGRKKVLIAEFDLNNPRYIAPLSEGGYGLDGQWIDEFHHSLHALITGEVDGYYEDFGKATHLAKSLEESYVYTGEYSPHRKKFFGRSPEGRTYDQFIVFAQNHDHIGNRLLGDRLTTQLSTESLKLTAAAYLLSPHVPMLFMGEEYGEKNPFQYFISHTDKKLVDLVRKGRKEEFSYFNWKDEVPDPQSEEVFEQCILSWNIESDQRAQNLFAYYQYLIDFRKQRPAMKAFRRETLKVLSVNEHVICFERKTGHDYLLFILNFSKNPASFHAVQKQKVKKIFDSSSTRWDGPGENPAVDLNTDATIQLNPESILIFELN